MKTCIPNSIFSSTFDPAIPAAICISIWMWLHSQTDELLVLHYTFPDVLFFLSGIWITQIWQTPQEHPHIKEDTQGSSVFWEKFTYKLLQGAPTIKISSQEKGEQMKE